MVLKIVAFCCVLALPFSIVFWYRSHIAPHRYRCDVTLYKSMWIGMKDGICALELLSMPTKTASRTEFRTLSRHDPSPTQASFMLSSRQLGPNSETRIIFPLWLPTVFLLLVGAMPLARWQTRRWWRKRNGWCLECGYDLTGNRSGRCSECGHRFR